MVFSSLVFMFAYLPITLLAYYLVPRQGRNIFLFIVNLIFYGWGEPRLVLLMVFNIFFNYIGGWLVDKYRADAKKKKLFLILTCVLDIGILAVFKYTGMITETLNMLPFLNIPELQISLPIGISFYTFQTMSYVIDVYRDDAPVSKNFINFGRMEHLLKNIPVKVVLNDKTALIGAAYYAAMGIFEPVQK